MSSISVYLESGCTDIAKLAERLGGKCASQKPIEGGIEQVFKFALESRAEQFCASVLLFPELISVGSPVKEEEESAV